MGNLKQQEGKNDMSNIQVHLTKVSKEENVQYTEKKILKERMADNF